jgi:cation diffusion facilitator family transporter
VDAAETQRRKDASALEQRTLTVSLYGVIVVAVGSIVWGLILESDTVILNGVFTLFSLIGSGLSLAAAKVVTRPADRRFPYGYAHVEPLVHCVNGMMILIVCVYAFINGVEGVRAGGDTVDANGVVAYSIVSGIVCAVMWAYERHMARRVQSELIDNDAKDWLMDLGFSAVTLVGFAVLPLLPEPYHSIWARYADSVMVCVMALLLLPVPIDILNRNLREVLLMRSADEALAQRVDAVMAQVRREHDIADHSAHVAKTGRYRFIEINIVAGPAFAAQTVREQDELRSRIWRELDLSLEDTWLSLCITADPRWS